MKTKIIILVIVLSLAAFLRLFQLDELPSILNRDEAALAYNAYLLAENGKDEWQQIWPLTFKSFGDYKLPGYIYTLALLFKLLPLSDFAVRLPSALSGVLLVLVAYKFAVKVLRVQFAAAMIMSLLVAVLPIFTFYSRIAFEANMALFLLVASLYFMLKDKANDLLAVLLLVTAIATYNTPLLLLPFFVPMIIAWRIKKPVKNYLYLVLAMCALGIISFMILRNLQSQKSGITIFADPTTWVKFAMHREKMQGIAQKLFANQYVFYAQMIFFNVINMFDLDFLVRFGGSHPWHSVPFFGHMFYTVYFLSLAMLVDILGELFFKAKEWKKRVLKKEHLLVLYLLFVALAPSVVTVDSPHATRSLLFFFILVCLTTLFVNRLLEVFAKRKDLVLMIVFVLLAVEASVYHYRYFSDYPNQQSKATWVEYKELIQTVEADYPQHQVAVEDGDGYQYILTAWYLRVPAADFFTSMRYQNANAINFHYGETLTHYHFIANPADRSESETIFLSRNSGILK